MLLLFSAAAIIFLIDGIPLIKKNQWAEFTVFALVLIIACALFVARDMGIVPLKLMGDLFKGLGRKLFG